MSGSSSCGGLSRLTASAMSAATSVSSSSRCATALGPPAISMLHAPQVRAGKLVRPLLRSATHRAARILLELPGASHGVVGDPRGTIEFLSRKALGELPSLLSDGSDNRRARLGMP